MSSTPKTINVSIQKVSFAALLTALLNGINTDLAGVDPIVIDGTNWARKDLLARIQAVLDGIQQVKDARKTLATLVANQKELVAEGRQIRAGVKRVAQAKYGPKSPKLQDFGFTPQRSPNTPVASKAKGQAKSKATRAAGGTKALKRQQAAAQSQTQAATPAPAPATPTTAPVTATK
jgi:hypothetical protein